MQKTALVILLVLLVISCNHQTQVRSYEPRCDSLPPVQTADPDSINDILKKIHAKEKAALIDSWFSTLVTEKKFNGTVLVAQERQVIFRKAYGYADFTTRNSLTTASVFQLASTSKPFTAFGVMMLKEAGLLSYDDTLQKYFPDFPYSGITVRHLLTHRSGLPNYIYFSEQYWPDYQKPMKNSDVLQMLETYKPRAYHKPDVRFRYSNTGYCLLVLIIEKVSGMSFERFMRNKVFDPLGMKNTFVMDMAKDTVFPGMTRGHNQRRKVETLDWLDGVVGDKHICSTVEDLFLWDQELYNCSLLKKETIEEAFIPSDPESHDRFGYGLGWRIIPLESGNRIFHRGWWRGYNSYFSRKPDDKTTIIILTNVANKSIYNISGLEKILCPQENI